MTHNPAVERAQSWLRELWRRRLCRTFVIYDRPVTTRAGTDLDRQQHGGVIHQVENGFAPSVEGKKRGHNPEAACLLLHNVMIETDKTSP